MDKASESILALQPVTFRYKPDLDPDGKPYSVRYEAANAMLLNEFLKEHRTVQDSKATVAKRERQIEVLTEDLQKVSAQLEASKSAPRVVVSSY